MAAAEWMMSSRMEFCGILLVGVILLVLCRVESAMGNNEGEEDKDLNQTFFITEIFDKYGNNNIMTYEGFEHLLENLGLGKLKFERKHDVSIHKINGTFREVHDELLLHKHDHNGDGLRNETNERSRRKRNLQTEDLMVENLRRKCLTAQDILRTYGLKPYHEVVISPSKYLQMCPAIIYELDNKLCHAEDTAKESRQKQEDRHLVWIYASASVLGMSLSGMLCVLLVPCLKRGRSSWALQFLIAMAVGTLCGDAVIHLLPQVFCMGNNPELEALATSKGTLCLSAIYFFFIVENVLKGMRSHKQKKTEGSKELGAMISFEDHNHKDNCNQGHSHGTTVAWMAIMGDILHNVTDGLSIGAAFRASLSSGFASSIAIFCHELPHELGDYAILLASGMSIKKSLFCNVLSSVFSFLGMVTGILLADFEGAALWINAFTAGSFLYIALSDLVPEMKSMQDNSNCKSFITQTVGLSFGGILMLIIALYENQIESLLCCQKYGVLR